MYVEKLYGDNLSEEEKAKEIAKLEEQKQEDNMNLGDFGLNEMDEDIADGNSPTETGNEKATV